jgi:urease accessory protein
MAIGAFLGMLGIPVPFIETGIVLSVALIGLLLLVRDIKLSYILPLIALFGFIHGNAHGIEAPQTANATLYTLGFILSTSTLHLSGILLGKAIKERFVRLAGLSLLLLALAL